MKRRVNNAKIALAGQAFPGKAFPGLEGTRCRAASRARRGVLLLVVLSLLMLFSLVAVTFVLLSSRHYETTRYAIKHEQTGDDPRQLLDEVFAQCIRGTDNPHSVLGPHSLLEDIYGNDGIKYTGTTTAALFGTNQPVITLTFTPTAAPNYPNAGSANSIYYSAFPAKPVYADRPANFRFPFSAIELQTAGYLNGRVFTAVGGAADGLSTRVLGWSYATLGGVYTVNLLAFEGVTPAEVVADPPTGFVINGRPFSGTGFGFNPAADPADAVAPPATLLNAGQSFTIDAGGNSVTISAPYALLPNPVFFQGNSDSAVTVNNDPNYTTFFGGIGGADEDYDAPDAQNMLLAYVPLNANSGGVSRVIPSLHRPETIDWLRQRNTDPITNAAYHGNQNAQGVIERQASLRPHSIDHDQFPKLTLGGTVSSSFADAYDVDNDGDGVTDSIWVDAGLPVRTAPDGRMYKPLVAILCVDLDGRLNVNAHGTITQTNPAYATAISPVAMAGQETLANYLFSSTGTGVPVTMRRGLGAGPAEINLRGLFTTPADYLGLFKGGAYGGINYEGRYGEWNQVSGTYGSPLPGRSTSTLGADDYLAQIARAGRPTNYFGGIATGYSSPGDLWGRMALGLDYAGQPVYSYLNSGGTELVASSAVANRPEDELPYDPYSVNLMRARATQNMPTANDNLYSVAELERLLRVYDGDAAGLPERLRAVLNGAGGASALELAKLVTTDSYDVPVSNAAMTRDMASLLRSQNGNEMPPAAGIIELARAKIAQQLGVAVTDTQVQTALNTLINNRIIAPELIAGQKFNVNRPFGNGQDDDGDLTVDEPDEYSTAKEVPTAWSGITGFTAPTFMDLDRDGVQTIPVNPGDPTESAKARQAYAQQLYFLMMLVSDQSYMWAKAATVINATQQAELTSRQIAQWAINVVDFRDPDAIMTGFEYDLNPFNGWDVDGDLRTNDASDERRVVCGAEFPDLLLTETLALHDRRVSDTDQDPSGKDRTETVDPPADTTLDQTHLPQGSVFFELMNTRPASPAQQYPAELYQGGQLDLGKRSPADTNGTSWPVWRIAITESIANPSANVMDRAIRYPDSTGFGPYENGADKGRVSIFRVGNAWGGTVTVERMVVFTPQPPTGTGFEDVTFFNKAMMPTLLQPGGIALIGPRPLTSVGTNGSGAPGSQRIQLTPSVEILNALNPTGYFATHPNAMTPLPIVCSSVRIPPGWSADKFPTGHYVGVNVTEPMPLAYYSNIPSGSYDNAQDLPPAYSPPVDEPLDSRDPNSILAMDLANGLTTILHTGSTANYKHAILQRLANPLEAFNQATNPYITVDWQPIPLVMYNGEQAVQADQGSDGQPWDIDDPNWDSTPPGSLALTNYGRGLVQVGASAYNPWNIVSPLVVQAMTATMQPVHSYNATSSGSDVFPYQIQHTLGYLNSEIGTPWATANPTIYRNVPEPTGAGAKPYPWLTWNNRPYVSEAELMLVPAASAEELLRKFTAPDNTLADNPYLLDPDSYHLPFKHLFNFRLSSTGLAGSAPNYARVLDYLHVPSPFIGTETILDWDTALGTVTGSPSLLAPFNAVSRMREPGRININTIPGDLTGSTNPVWDALLNTHGVPNPGPTWTEIVSARRGTAGNLLDPTTHSSFFARPFRSASGAMYGLPGTSRPGAMSTDPELPISEIESTLLRPATTGGPKGLFEDFTIATQYNDPVRNAFFRNQPMLRMRNLLTTRSNVYAIWVTVGFFEVRTAGSTGPGTAFPDGYQLFGELGSDTGEIKRHRAFYIYDRSIPVAFERGKDHNMADGILLKRFIE